MTGVVIGLVGAVAWEWVEIVLPRIFPISLVTPPLDTVVDVLLGSAAGGLAAFSVDRFFDSN